MRCFVAIGGFIAAPVTAQEPPVDGPVAIEAPATAEAEAPEMTEEAEKAIERGLKFLISSQNKDGSWSSKDLENRGAGYAIGGTSLGLMAFMVEGHFPWFRQVRQGARAGEELPAQKSGGFPYRRHGRENV